MEVEPTGPIEVSRRFKKAGTKASSLSDREDGVMLGENQELGRGAAAVGTRRRGRIWRNCLGHVAFQVSVQS